MSTKAQLHRELRAQVKELGVKMLQVYGHVQNKEVRRRAQKIAAAPLLEDMIQNAPTSRLSASVDIYEPPKGHFTFTGPNYKKGGQLAWIFEYGTVDRFKKKGSYTGQMDAKPFVRPAYRRHKNTVLMILEREFEKEIQNKIKDVSR